MSLDVQEGLLLTGEGRVGEVLGGGGGAHGDERVREALDRLVVGLGDELLQVVGDGLDLHKVADVLRDLLQRGGIIII